MSDKSVTDPISDEFDTKLASAAPTPFNESEASVEIEPSIYDRETEPNIDVEMLRVALTSGLNQ